MLLYCTDECWGRDAYLSFWIKPINGSTTPVSVKQSVVWVGSGDFVTMSITLSQTTTEVSTQNTIVYSWYLLLNNQYKKVVESIR